MFKIAKYYILLNLYRKAKRNIIAIILSVVAAIFISFVFADLVEMSSSGSRYIFVAIKWLILLALFSVIAFNVLKTAKALSVLFAKEESGTVWDAKKEMILDKEHLVSRSELILNKYRNS